MRNRAKCKLCNSIVESFHQYDFVQCTCGEIFVDAGEGLRCGAKNWNNFVRIDDEGKEIVPKIVVGDEVLDTTQSSKPSKEEATNALKELIASYNNLPHEALYAPVTHDDLKTILSILQYIISI